jgi:hypothetical protein
MIHSLKPTIFIVLSLFVIISHGISAPTEMEMPLAIVALRGQPIKIDVVESRTSSAAIHFEGSIAMPDQWVAEEIKDSINDSFADLDVENILTEECFDLMKSSKKMAFPDMKIVDQVFSIPGTEDLYKEVIRPFKTRVNLTKQDSLNEHDWKSSTKKWLNSQPNLKVLNSSNWGQETYSLEVSCFSTWISEENRYVGVELYMRLVDHNENKIVRKVAYVTGTEALPLKSRWRDPAILIPIYRECIREAAEKGLKKLRMF